MNTHRYALAVVICTWNRANVLQQTLDSLARSVAPPSTDVHVIVVDNNSTDDTRARIVAAQAHWSLGRLHHAFEPRQGKQFALNHGIALAERLGCDGFVFTDDDIWFESNWLIPGVARLRAAQGPVLFGGKTAVVWPGGVVPSWYHTGMGAVVGEVDLGPVSLSPAPTGYAPAGANLWANQALFAQIGPFSEPHYRHMDYELGMRAQRLGVTLSYDPAVVVDAPVDEKILTCRYFLRWAFKAGFGHWQVRDVQQAHWLWVPRWVWRQMLQEGLAWLRCCCAGASESQAFYHRFQLARLRGLVASRWVSRWRPQHYEAWVKRYSQKKGDLF